MLVAAKAVKKAWWHIQKVKNYASKIFFQETIAQERVECHDRIDRRAIRERIAIDRHSAARSALLRQEMINLFEQSLKGMEERHRLDIDNRYGQSKTNQFHPVWCVVVS